MGSPSGATAFRGRGYIVLSWAVGVILVLALARANYLVGETVGSRCGDFRDAVRWSFMIRACRLSDVGRFDLVNGGLVVLAMLAALNPTLLILRAALLALVMMYLGDAGRMHVDAIAAGHFHPGIELWWMPISWLSSLILVVAAGVTAFEWMRRWLHG